MKDIFKIYGIWLALVIFTGVSGFFITWPMFSRILTSSESISRLNQENDSKKSFLDNLNTIKEGNELENYQTKWDIILPQNQDQGDFFAIMLEDLAKKNSITADTITYEKTSGKPTGISLAAEIEAINYTFTGSGSYDAINTFMAQSAKLSRLNSIKHVTIVPKEGIYTLNITGEIYKIKGTPVYQSLTSFAFFEELKTKTSGLIEFVVPSANEVPIGKPNPFTQ